MALTPATTRASSSAASLAAYVGTLPPKVTPPLSTVTVTSAASTRVSQLSWSTISTLIPSSVRTIVACAMVFPPASTALSKRQALYRLGYAQGMRPCSDCGPEGMMPCSGVSPLHRLVALREQSTRGLPHGLLMGARSPARPLPGDMQSAYHAIGPVCARAACPRPCRHTVVARARRGQATAVVSKRETVSHRESRAVRGR